MNVTRIWFDEKNDKNMFSEIRVITRKGLNIQKGVMGSFGWFHEIEHYKKIQLIWAYTISTRGNLITLHMACMMLKGSSKRSKS